MLAYEVLTGALLPETGWHLTLAAVPPRWRPLLDRLLAVKPELRPADARSFLDELETWLGQSGIS